MFERTVQISDKRTSFKLFAKSMVVKKTITIICTPSWEILLSQIYSFPLIDFPDPTCVLATIYLSSKWIVYVCITYLPNFFLMYAHVKEKAIHQPLNLFLGYKMILSFCWESTKGSWRLSRVFQLSKRIKRSNCINLVFDMVTL